MLPKIMKWKKGKDNFALKKNSRFKVCQLTLLESIVLQSCEKHGLQRKRRRKNCQFANRSKYVFCALLLFFRIERCCISCGWQLLAELSCCCSCPISSKPSLTWRPNSLTPIRFPSLTVSLAEFSPSSCALPLLLLLFRAVSWVPRVSSWPHAARGGHWRRDCPA